MVNQLQIKNQALKVEKETLESLMDELLRNQSASEEEQNGLQSMVNKLQNDVKILQVEKEGLSSLTDELLQKQSEMTKDSAQGTSTRSMIKELQNEIEKLRNENNA
eukprot:39358_1